MSLSYLHYNILEKLGEGGMGVVYLADDTRLKRKVALKFLPQRIADDPAEHRRFKLEASAAAGLNHPNIAQVHAIEEAEGNLFIVMEYVQGDVLEDLIASEVLDIEKKTAIALQIAEGLQAAHDRDIIHRDIKSSNIMVSDAGLVKVMDFGLARIRGSEHITKPGSTLGTASYMAPELIAGNECDARSDIWSFGVVLYELFSNALPFQGVYEPAVMYAIMEEAPRPLPQAEGALPKNIRQVIMQCLEKDPDARYQCMRDIIDQLQPGNPKQARPARPLAGMSPGQYRAAAGGLAVMAAAVIFMYAMGLFSPEKQIAEKQIPEKKFLAVLPIEIIGDSPGLQSISDALSETFSYRLSALEKYENSYWVAPASEMRREKINSATQAKKLFGVNLVIVSSIQSLNDSTRFSLELVDADKMRRIGSEQIMVPSSNLAQLEVYGVRAMVKMLDITISDTVDKTITDGRPAVPEAYEYYLKGIAALQDYSNIDSLASAENFFKQAIASDDGFALAYAGLGEAYWQQYQTTKDSVLLKQSADKLNKALLLNKNLAPVQTSLGLLKTTLGTYDEAIAHFKQALKIDIKYTPAYQGMARAFDKKGDSKKAIEAYEQAISLKPDYWESHKDLGTHYLMNGEFDHAIEQYRQVITMTPGSSTAYSNLGVAYYYNGQMEQARAMFEHSLALENNPLTANNLAGIYFWQKNYDKAAAMYEVALNEFAHRYEIWGNLAAAYELGGHQAKARETYRIAIKKAEEQLRVNPNDVYVLADLGAYHSDLGHRQQALQYISKALGMGKDDIVIRQRAVAVYEKLGLREMALEWITAAMTNDLEMQPELENLVNDPKYVALKATFRAQH